MLRLGDTPYWLDITDAGDAWILKHRTGGKRPKVVSLGRYTSPRHALQCQPKLAKKVKAELELLARSFEIGDAALDDIPKPGEEEPESS